jgi:murein L,D-transpeptidase YafK
MKTGWRLLAAAVLVAAAAPGPSQYLHASQPEAERLLIDKSDRTLKVMFAGGRVVTLQGLRFGPNWRSGPKRQRGDRKTPEGEYRVLEHRTSREIYPEVTYLPALYLNYPNEQDVEASAMLGVDPGDAIMIHGPHPDVPESVLHAQGDWTDGCAALSAVQMAYLAQVTGEGTPVTIRP